MKKMCPCHEETTVCRKGLEMVVNRFQSSVIIQFVQSPIRCMGMMRVTEQNTLKRLYSKKASAKKHLLYMKRNSDEIH